MMLFIEVLLVFLLAFFAIVQENYALLILAILFYVLFARLESLLNKLKKCDPWWY